MGSRLVAALALAAAQAARPPAAAAPPIAARAIQPGELVVLTIDAGPAAPVRVRAFGRELTPFRSDAGWRVLVGIDLDVRPGTHPVEIETGGTPIVRDLVVLPKTFRTRRLTVDPDFVTPPPSAAERIAADAKLLQATWRSSVYERLWTGAFIRPVADAANSAFGSRSVFNGKLRSAHGGADFMSAAGTEIHAPNAGRIAIARDLYYSGNTVVIDHGLGLFSMLAHLSAFTVREGDRVEAGQVVGRVGATGRVTGPHLHWAVRVNDARVDPLSLLAVLGARTPN